MGCEHVAEFGDHIFSGKKVLPRDGLNCASPAFAIRAVVGAGLERDKINPERKSKSSGEDRTEDVI